MEGVPQQQSNSVEINRQAYLNLVNDFGFLISLNAAHLDQQVQTMSAHEAILNEMLQTFRKPLINGKSYAEFMAEHADKLTDPQVASVLLKQIHGFLTYIEPRLFIFKADSAWVRRFKKVKDSYKGVAMNQS